MFAASIFMMFLLATTSCNEPSLIGADVIDTDRPDVVFTDTLTLFASSIEDDSIRTFDDLNLLTTYLCGKLEDPIFGISEAEINTQLRLTGTPDSASFLGILNGDTELDSVVFVLEYDPDQFFGNPISQQEVSVYLLIDDMDNNATYYSNDNFEAGELLFTGIVNPSEPDTTILLISAGDTIYPPQLRLTLDANQAKNHPLFADFLFKDISSLDYYQNDTSLLEVFKGVKVRVENTGGLNDPNDIMMAFLLSSSSLGGMYMHYHTPNDTLFYRFEINNDAAQMVNFKHNYDNSFVKPYIDTLDDETDGEQYIFAQGMQGVNGKIRIPYASGLKDAIINQAQLELTIATIMDDNTFYESNPLEQLFLSKRNDEGNLVTIADLQVAFGGNLVGIFGGNLVEKTKNNMVIKTYTMNISEHLQDMINGLESSDEIFITTIAKAQSANRSIIFGTGHPTYAPKLNVTYTINQ